MPERTTHAAAAERGQQRSHGSFKDVAGTADQVLIHTDDQRDSAAADAGDDLNYADQGATQQVQNDSDYLHFRGAPGWADTGAHRWKSVTRTVPNRGGQPRLWAIAHIAISCVSTRISVNDGVGSR